MTKSKIKTFEYGMSPDFGTFRTHLEPKYRKVLYYAAFMQAVRMIADHCHEHSINYGLPPHFKDDLSQHTRMIMVKFFQRKARCICNECTLDKRRIIEAGSEAARRYMHSQTTKQRRPCD